MRESLGKSSWDGEDLNRDKLVAMAYRYYPHLLLLCISADDRLQLNLFVRRVWIRKLG